LLGRQLAGHKERTMPYSEDAEPMSIADELEKLHQLRQAGAIDDYEFAQAKTKILNGSQGSPSVDSPGLETASGNPSKDSTWVGPSKEERETRRWALFLHLSVLAGYALPIAGIAVPIAIWQLMKDSLPKIDSHGKNAINWVISFVIYVVVGIILIPAFGLGILVLSVVGVLAVVFPIIAAIKANNGEVWKYPLSISILK
jgi:uncharacterized Tic20 family protein